MLSGVPAQGRHEVSGIRQAELPRRPRQSTEILGRHSVSEVSHDGVVELHDGRGVLGGKTRGGTVLALGVNPGTELTIQTGYDELHQGLTGERGGRGGSGQQPASSLAQLETRRRGESERKCFKTENYISDICLFLCMCTFSTCLVPCRSLVVSGMKKNVYSDIRPSWTSVCSIRAEGQDGNSSCLHILSRIELQKL